ncbi:MAG: glycosyltransferase family 4 protein [Ignavibacteriales bacterium]|nr:glycosyltransferase family 4 protein [Ignavibacteriales bacterium]
MHVLFATSQATALTRGGVRTQVLQTKEALEHLGVHVTLFDTWRDFHANEFDLVHVFSANMATYHFARAVKAQGLPLVISPVFYTRRTAKTVQRVINVDRLISRTVRGIWTDYGLIAEMCSWAEAVTPNTTEEGKLFVDAFGVPEKKLIVVPNGVEERFAHAAPGLFEREYGIKNFILSVGHIGPERKNIFRLIEALERIDHPAAIIGRIENTPSGRACLERASSNPRLLIVDAIPHDSMLLASAYAACDVFVLPSQFETPGIAALEAGLAGAKIVITPVGGTKDYFGNDAIYVEPTSTENIAEGIQTALKNKKDTVLRTRIQKEFLWERVGEKIKQVYDNILDLA